MENCYEINKGTMCLIQNEDGTTKITENEGEYVVKRNIHKIIDEHVDIVLGNHPYQNNT